MEIDYRLLVNLVNVLHGLVALHFFLGWLPITTWKNIRERLTAFVGARLIGLYESHWIAIIFATIIGQVTYCNCPLEVLERSLLTRHNPEFNQQIESVVAPWLNQTFGLQLAPEIPTVLYLLALYLLSFIVMGVLMKKWTANVQATHPARTPQ